ncbi:DUF1800 domain-containing protein [Scleromatobacter humisilvae]|uniref:DUF1800 domain-containing protein n=1 Tax=Scleromatobacter humisilvae TaxID=2897159 RepID=A0A9X1YQP8_9BURK|nr:DUF1800 domain-containing protein [Scleromatobacter humisilvae]MCK9689503.1 DUF1800 domain-containing protein [Scleromatobacter humisilvae]
MTRLPFASRTRARCTACALAAAGVLAACGTSPTASPLGPAPVVVLPDTHQEADAMRVSTLDAQRVDRATFGVDATVLQQVGRLGYARWVDDQLHPKPFALPASVDARIAAMRIVREPLAVRLREDVKDKKAADAVADDEQKKSAQQAYQKGLNAQADEAAQRWLLVAVGSPNQVQERLVWFWLNHFSIAQNKANLRAFAGDYEIALRAHALGRFRDLLEASATHPAMLRYLDNERNAAGQINENYARELMELHTLGVDAGYTQADVQEMARVLTGLGVRVDADDAKVKPPLQSQYVHAGAFEFNPNRHDQKPKQVLGQAIAPAGLAEVRQVLDRLARNPATARHVSAQLAQYFVGDTPPPGLVDRMAQRWLATDGDIAQVMKTLLTSPEYDASLGRHFKDPWEYVLSATRLAYDGNIVVNPQPLLNALRQLSEPPFGRETPDGFPMIEAAWASPGQMTTRFDVARSLVGGNGGGNANLFKVDGLAPPAALPKARVESAAWLRTQAPRESEATRQALLETLQAHPGDWAWAAVVSPEFMRN